MPKVNVGIIGCGATAQFHARAAARSPRINLVAVSDVKTDPARQMANTYKVPKVYHNDDELLDDPEVQAVVLAVPTHLRAAPALKAFGAGKHVLTEKPVGMNAAEVQKMIAARGRLVGASCTSRNRFLRQATVAAEILASGKLGHLRRMRVTCIWPATRPTLEKEPVWRLSKKLNGGGIMANWGCCDLDFMLGINAWKLKPKAVLAATYGPPAPFIKRLPKGSDAETHVAAFITFQEGISMTLERAEMNSSGKISTWEIAGEMASLRMEMNPGSHNPDLLLEEILADGSRRTQVLVKDGGSMEDIHSGPVIDFANAILDNRPPKTTLEQALIISQLTDAVYSSAQTGLPVVL
ncbi:hypothetical protein DB346_06755 [Verrucomicrobia bacterium LW23]|nr:hypothetical protein DB346_06755 [Verrucomicrobia bacterium LW23]